jgi:hypothetical protein
VTPCLRHEGFPTLIATVRWPYLGRRAHRETAGGPAGKERCATGECGRSTWRARTSRVASVGARLGRRGQAWRARGRTGARAAAQSAFSCRSNNF